MENNNVASPLKGEGIRGDGQAKWYVVHTYSGHENKVKVNIEKMVENRGMQDLVLDIIVPTEDRVEIKDGQRKIKTRKMFPGYVIIKMIVTNESWYLVRNTQGVTGFVGHGSDPIPLTDEEVARMGIEKVYIDLDGEIGDTDFLNAEDIWAEDDVFIFLCHLLTYILYDQGDELEIIIRA